jgi:hypothetical protein
MQFLICLPCIVFLDINGNYFGIEENGSHMCFILAICMLTNKMYFFLSFFTITNFNFSVSDKLSILYKVLWNIRHMNF